MSNSDPRTWLDKSVGVCFSALVCALAIYVAVRLIEAVAVALLVILGVGGLVTCTLTWFRGRHRGW